MEKGGMIAQCSCFDSQALSYTDKSLICSGSTEKSTILAEQKAGVVVNNCP